MVMKTAVVVTVMICGARVGDGCCSDGDDGGGIDVYGGGRTTGPGSDGVGDVGGDNGRCSDGDGW